MFPRQLLLTCLVLCLGGCFDSDELPPSGESESETGAELRDGYHDPNCPEGGPGCPCGDYERCADGLACDAAGLCVPECKLAYTPCDVVAG